MYMFLRVNLTLSRLFGIESNNNIAWSYNMTLVLTLLHLTCNERAQTIVAVNSIKISIEIMFALELIHQAQMFS